MVHLILWILLIPVVVLANPTCPQESMLVEFVNPGTGGKKSLCAYFKDGQTIKHGEEWTYDRNGTLVKKVNFIHGNESNTPAAIPAVETAPKVSAESEARTLNAIKEILRVMTMKRSLNGKSTFKVSKCDNTPMEWLKAALFKSVIKRAYSFGDHCDVNGTFEAKFGQEFPVSFGLRNLEDFKNTKMNVILKIEKHERGLRYSVEIPSGNVTSASKNIEFRLNYNIEIDPMTGNPSPNSEQGKVILTKINNDEVSVESPIEFGD